MGTDLIAYGGMQNAVDNFVLSAIPEPSTALLLGIGLRGGGGREVLLAPPGPASAREEARIRSPSGRAKLAAERASLDA